MWRPLRCGRPGGAPYEPRSLCAHGLELNAGTLPETRVKASSRIHSVLPPPRNRYLAEISETVRTYHAETTTQAQLARERHQLAETKRMLDDARASSADLDAL